MAVEIFVLEKLPPAPPSLQVPPVADPPVVPPKAAELPPLQMSLNALPALAVGCVQLLILAPVIEANVALLKVVAQRSVVLEEGIVLLATPFLTASVDVVVCSFTIVKLVGYVVDLKPVLPTLWLLTTNTA